MPSTIKTVQAFNPNRDSNPESCAADCPKCGGACSHTATEMQGFANDALQAASDGYARDVAACERANDKQRIAELEKLVSELRCSPPAAFVNLVNDGTYRYWMAKLVDNSSTHRERKGIVRALREHLDACAIEQRSAGHITLQRSLLTETWLTTDKLPPPYEEVRILFDDGVRIARLAHNKEAFQLSSYYVNVKHQYVVPVEKVQGWQPLVAAPAPSETSSTAS